VYLASVNSIVVESEQNLLIEHPIAASNRAEYYL